MKEKTKAVIKEILLIRHGQTDFNVQRRFCGSTDIELNPRGIAETEALAKRLAAMQKTPGKELCYILSSPLLRARRTAEIVGCSIGMAVVTDLRLTELDHGELEGEIVEDTRRRNPEVLENFLQGDCKVPLPGGESMEQVQTRAWNVVQELQSFAPGPRVALFTHQMVILTIVCKVLGLPVSAWRNMRTDRASITSIVYSRGGWVLYKLNDSAHIDNP
ncbi:MAG: histidine phosphatase family protein [Deltaproteobacteria bacterium]|nr:histidine phosphatase family protein [Deltaproteobacteria bacterium]